MLGKFAVARCFAVVEFRVMSYIVTNYYINAHSRLRQSAGHSRAGARDALQCPVFACAGCASLRPPCYAISRQSNIT